ncbi:hypothetical protein [Caulobacter hibisci]|uniref:Uncharacterized protein n=1 Tax=Caulobacter hibisci TaxID=2035993 RepID=A0ABS0T007_9CAUL|nr:hypothetical protein [Caulobacter hibisci]MBI1684450.1 hypothetical protein [Caulobacter hibisci]
MKIQGDRNYPVPVQGLAAKPKAIFQATLTSAAQSLAALRGSALPDGAVYAMIRVETANGRWRDDGVDPTVSVGMLLATSDQPLIYDGDLAALKLIAASGSPVLTVALYA